MAAAGTAQAIYRLFTGGCDLRWIGAHGVARMTGLALAMFIALFGFGHELVGWNDPGGSVKLGLFMAFLFGIICGYRSKA